MQEAFMTEFRSAPMSVLPEWIDYNGHLNMAYYSVLMDKCADQAYPALGFGPDYRDETRCTTCLLYTSPSPRDRG